jgi:hypothetical protein
MNPQTTETIENKRRMLRTLLRLCVLALPVTAHAAPECREPSAVCAALLDEVADRCEASPRTCRLAVPRYEAVEHCEDVERAARAVGAPVALAVWSAYVESGLDPAAVSSVGARGLLQAIPRYWCPADSSCDLTMAGVVALHTLVERYGDVRGVGYYRSGRVALRDGYNLRAARARIDAAKAIKLRIAKS